jgi:hypothetical protein
VLIVVDVLKALVYTLRSSSGINLSLAKGFEAMN